VPYLFRSSRKGAFRRVGRGSRVRVKRPGGEKLLVQCPCPRRKMS
jgi:hypothetical protein